MGEGMIAGSDEVDDMSGSSPPNFLSPQESADAFLGDKLMNNA